MGAGDTIQLSPMDASAADMIWACAPHMAPTISAGVAPVTASTGAPSPERSSLLALTCGHVSSIIMSSWSTRRP
ncbi:hypothetical protein [Nonomuraea sp. B1E8]|uniref:hypothetical protein n=1 Tax=unclassified Nonomuraea TaxID=2593643 RepID=UPI00325E645D